MSDDMFRENREWEQSEWATKRTDVEWNAFIDRVAARLAERINAPDRRPDLSALCAELREAETEEDAGKRGEWRRLNLLIEIAENACYYQGAKEDQRIGQEIAAALRRLTAADLDQKADQAVRDSEIRKRFIFKRLRGVEWGAALRELAQDYGKDKSTIRTVIEGVSDQWYLDTFREFDSPEFGEDPFPDLDEDTLARLLRPSKKSS